MEQPTPHQTDAPTPSPAGIALTGVILAVIGGLLIAQAGGGDREFFLSVGLGLETVGLLAIIIGGVALGIRLARD